MGCTPRESMLKLIVLHPRQPTLVSSDALCYAAADIAQNHQRKGAGQGARARDK